MRIVKETSFDFMSKTKITSFISTLFLIVGFSSLVINKGPKLSIDFVGGTMVAVNFTEPIEIDNLRSSLKSVNILGQIFDLSSSEIKYFGDKSNI